MAKYVILIQSGPDNYAVAEDALALAQELIDEKHTLLQVFFYGPGVTFANQYLQMPSGVPDYQAQWLEFAAANDLPLVVCSTVGTQYGLEAQDHPDGNLQPGFSAGGLAEFMEVLEQADHLEQF